MSEQPSLPRRRLIGYAGTAGAAALAGGVAGRLTAPGPAPVAEPLAEKVIRQSYSPHEQHQAGIITPTPASTRLIAFTLRRKTDAAALQRLLKLWSGDIAALMAGEAPPGDPFPETNQPGTSLSITVGLGPGVFELAPLATRRPVGLVDIPPLSRDRLQPRWSGGDLLLLIAADDATTVAQAGRRLVVDAETFATVAWVQDGSWRGTDPSGQPLTGRNLFGQVDGTGNPKAQDLEDALWTRNAPTWFAGGTTLVVRRIEMDLDFWDATTRERQEKVIGRRLSDGAPLTGSRESEALNLQATDAAGRPVIPVDAHARRSHPTSNGGRRIVRRGVNYTHEQVTDGRLVTSAGLIFMSFQGDIGTQFVPIQRQLDERDALNDWISHIGSAVFAIPGGFPAHGYLAQGLFE